MLSDLEELPTVNLGDFTLRIELDDLTPFDEEVAAKELRESPENRENGLKELRLLLKQGKGSTASLQLCDFFTIIVGRRCMHVVVISKSREHTDNIVKVKEVMNNFDATLNIERNEAWKLLRQIKIAPNLGWSRLTFNRVEMNLQDQELR